MFDSNFGTDGHMTRTKTTEAVESQNIFWRDMHLDIQAFVAACCACRHREPRRRSRTSKRTALRWYRGAEDDGDSDEEVRIDPSVVCYKATVSVLPVYFDCYKVTVSVLPVYVVCYKITVSVLPVYVVCYKSLFLY